MPGRPRDSAPVVIAGGGMAGVELAAAVADRLRAAGVDNPVLLVHSGAEITSRAAGGAAVGGGAGGATSWPGSVCRSAPVCRSSRWTTRASTCPTEPICRPPRCWAPSGSGRSLLPAWSRYRTTARAGWSQTRHCWWCRAFGPPVTPRGCTHARSGKPVPANALWAIKAGGVLGHNISRVITGRRPQPFRYRGLGLAMAFGLGRSATEMYGIGIPGFTGWLLRLGFFLRFMPQRRRAVAVLAAFALLPLRGRHVPAPDSLARPSVIPAG